MNKFTVMFSVWLWGGIILFLYMVIRGRKEIKKAGLETIHLCMLFLICCLIGLPIIIEQVFDFKKDNNDEDDEENDEYIEDDEDCNEVLVEKFVYIRECLDMLIRHFK